MELLVRRRVDLASCPSGREVLLDLGEAPHRVLVVASSDGRILVTEANGEAPLLFGATKRLGRGVWTSLFLAVSAGSTRLYLDGVACDEVERELPCSAVINIGGANGSYGSDQLLTDNNSFFCGKVSALVPPALALRQTLCRETPSLICRRKARLRGVCR